MEKVKILGVDPSLRNTGLARVTYNTEISPHDPTAFKIDHCQVLITPQKFKGTDAIIKMVEMIEEESQKSCYEECEIIIVESPAKMFNKNFSSAVVAALGHISGASLALFGVKKSHLLQPSQWNRGHNKEKTHNETIAFLGKPESWGYEKILHNDKYQEHILDAASMALWWIKNNFIEE